MIATVSGGAVIGADLFLSGCKTSGSNDSLFSQKEIALLDEVGETIIPATDTPGAKAAETGKFAALIVTDCYTEIQQAVFKEGLTRLETACRSLHQRSFMDCNTEQRQAFLITLEKEAKEADAAIEKRNKEKRDIHEQTNAKLAWKEQKEFIGEPPHYYTLIKQLTLWGYFSSKPGVTQALRHVPVPGKYDGNYDYKKGDRAFS